MNSFEGCVSYFTLVREFREEGRHATRRCQKRTWAVQTAMSALPPKADICSANRNVRFGPKADIMPERYKIARGGASNLFGNVADVHQPSCPIHLLAD